MVPPSWQNSACKSITLIIHYQENFSELNNGTYNSKYIYRAMEITEVARSLYF